MTLLRGGIVVQLADDLQSLSVLRKTP